MAEAGPGKAARVTDGMSLEWRIENRGTVTSTQADLLNELKAEADVHGLVIRATAQSHGRGRMERQWDSGPGGSYQSAAIRDVDGRLRSGRVSIAIALAIADSLQPKAADIALKWPNDLYRREKASVAGPVVALPGKVGGILCQHLRGYLLVGVGINVQNEVPETAAVIDDLQPDVVSDLVLAGIAGGLRDLDKTLPERYARFDLLGGRKLKVRVGRSIFGGLGRGVSDTGCLLLETEGDVTEICSGRIVEFDAAA